MELSVIVLALLVAAIAACGAYLLRRQRAARAELAAAIQAAALAAHDAAAEKAAKAAALAALEAAAKKAAKAQSAIDEDVRRIAATEDPVKREKLKRRLKSNQKGNKQ